MAESVENLGNGVELLISDSYGFGTDALLLADFADPHRNDRCMDLGTGCGIIPMIWYRNGISGDIYGLDIQEPAVDQFRRSLLRNDSPDNVHPVAADLCNLPKDLPLGTFRTVTMNPPYKINGTGILSASSADKLARHETACTLTDICGAARRLLNFGGKFCICNRPERLADVIEAMRAANIEPKRLRMVQKRPDTRPWLFLMEGRLGGKPYLDVLPPFYIQDESGGDSPELLRVLGSYREEENS